MVKKSTVENLRSSFHKKTSYLIHCIGHVECSVSMLHPKILVPSITDHSTPRSLYWNRQRLENRTNAWKQENHVGEIEILPFLSLTLKLCRINFLGPLPPLLIIEWFLVLYAAIGWASMHWISTLFILIQLIQMKLCVEHIIRHAKVSIIQCPEQTSEYIQLSSSK